MRCSTMSVFILILVASAIGPACRRGGDVVSLTGAGATFPYPLYSKWIAEYGKAHPNVQINYQSIGSGGGVKQIIKRTVDFGASDPPMSDEDLAKAAGPIIHIPTTIGAVVVVYNLPGFAGELRLDQETMTGIFLGEIRNWNDPRLAALNPAAALPDRPLAVVHRSDGSGTTAVFTEYLSNVSPAWKERVGAGKSVQWPTGLGAKGNEGVTGQVRSSPGAVGYVERAYAEQTGLPYATLRNRAGHFVRPTVRSVTAAAAAAVAAMPDDLRVSIVDAEGADAYPISSFTYILVPEDVPDARKGEALARFLWWAVHEGQGFAADLYYAPLPAEMMPQIEARLRMIKAAGRVVLGGR